MTTCPHCGQPMPTSLPNASDRRVPAPFLESLPETDAQQLAALDRRNLWPRADVVWRQESDDDAR